jgi:hypothetical protein
MKFIFRLIMVLSLISCANATPSFPLIIMGGVWSPESKPTYSNLSRVCNIGFTHAFSYITEPNIGESRSVTIQVKVSKQFADVIQNNCPQLGLVMGIPRDWIYHNRFDLISEYIESLQKNNIKVDYWLSDEVINAMINHGMKLESATQRASQIISFVENKSHVRYIWIEPGNYAPQYESILNNLSNIKSGIKSYDQYIISNDGNLANSVDKFNLLNTTLINLKQKNIVFPVCKIGVSANKVNYPTEEEFNSILVSLLMNRADGFVFWEERWTNNQTLALLQSSLKLITQIQNIGITRFSLIKSKPAIWKAYKNGVAYQIIINNTNESVHFHKINILPTQIYLDFSN